jgi:hypothetical protein
MKDKCDKHPVNIRGYNSIEKLAEDIGRLNYFSNKKLYGLLAEIYKRQSKEDGERGNKQLSPNLEELSKAFGDSVSKAIEKVCKTCEKHLENPYEQKSN